MSPVETPRVEDLLRELAPQVLGALVRRYGDFDSAEDAVQEALLAAAEGQDEAADEARRQIDACTDATMSTSRRSWASP